MKPPRKGVKKRVKLEIIKKNRSKPGVSKKIVRTKEDNISRTAIIGRKPGGLFGDFPGFLLERVLYYASKL